MKLLALSHFANETFDNIYNRCVYATPEHLRIRLMYKRVTAIVSTIDKEIFNTIYETNII